MWIVLALLATISTFVEGITWTVSGSVTWGQACDWTGGDIASVASTSSNCGGACVANANCDHFTWTNYNGGTCWLKHFGSSSVTAVSAGSTAVCGWVNARVGGSFSWQVSGAVTYAQGCDWTGGDIGSAASASSGCGPACQGNSNCDHFTWTNYNGGTCWLKHFGSSNPTAVNGPSGSLCGYISGSTTPTTTPPPSTIKGFYYWSWDASTPSYPVGTNIGVAFTGFADPGSAISGSSGIMSSLPGAKYISLGGGNSAGRFTASILTSITNSINSGAFNGYAGIVFDIEEGDSGLSGPFATAFQAAKNRGFKVLVTVSHSAPYGVTDASTLMNSFFSSTNIDYISPQLYTTGTESANDYTANTVSWTQYATSHAKIVPSIVRSSLYPAAQSYFSGLGITLGGYVQWSQS